jgi:hypothetical protein
MKDTNSKGEMQRVIPRESCLYANNIIPQSAIKLINNRYVMGISSCPTVSNTRDSQREWQAILSNVTNVYHHLGHG